MAKGRESFEKRRLQKVRQEKQAEKRDRRSEERPEDGEAVDETALMEQFRLISEQRSAGALTEEDYEAQRREIFVALGLEAAEA
ncbi:MAG: hypothetical protein ACKV2O_05890 [Acidimicrobiales bacterium]